MSVSGQHLQDAKHLICEFFREMAESESLKLDAVEWRDSQIPDLDKITASSGDRMAKEYLAREWIEAFPSGDYHRELLARLVLMLRTLHGRP